MPQFILGAIGVFIFVFFIVPAVLGTLAAAAGVFAVFLATRNAGRASAAAISQRRRLPPEIIYGEAHHAYLLGPAWSDLKLFFTDCNERALQTIATERQALRDADGPIKVPFRIFSLLFATTFGLLASVAVSTSIGLVLGIAAAMLAAVFGLLLITDRLWLVSRGWFLHCPHCDAKTYHLHYDCPHCTAVPPQRHRHLRVNRAGALYHHCATCRKALAAHALTGRGRDAQAYCTHCSLPVGRQLVEAKVAQVALVGGPDSGKTTLLVSAARWFQDAASLGGMKVELEEAAQRAQMASWVAQLARGQAPPKTSAVRHRAYTFMMSARGQRLRSLYVFDASGETFRNQTLRDEHGYIAQAAVILFALDPFSIPRYAEPLRETPRWAEVRAASPSATLPWEVASSMINMLDAGSAPRREGRFAIPLIVVLTKTDVLDLHRQLHGGADAVKDWLSAHGADDVVRVLETNFRDIQFRSVLTPLSGSRSATAPDGIDRLMNDVLARAMPDLRIQTLEKETA